MKEIPKIPGVRKFVVLRLRQYSKVAAKLGVSHFAYYRLLIGKRAMSKELERRIASAAGCTYLEVREYVRYMVRTSGKPNYKTRKYFARAFEVTPMDSML